MPTDVYTLFAPTSLSYWEDTAHGTDGHGFAGGRPPTSLKHGGEQRTTPRCANHYGRSSRSSSNTAKNRSESRGPTFSSPLTRKVGVPVIPKLRPAAMSASTASSPSALSRQRTNSSTLATPQRVQLALLGEREMCRRSNSPWHRAIRGTPRTVPVFRHTRQLLRLGTPNCVPATENVYIPVLLRPRIYFEWPVDGVPPPCRTDTDSRQIQ